jgi:hypothetical protein
MAAREIADHGQIRVGQNHPARIIRRREKQCARARRDRRFERRQVDAKSPRRRRRHAHHPRARHLERGGIAGIQRLERDHLIARSRDTQRGHEQGILRPGEEDDLRGVDRLSAARAVRSRDRFAQVLTARRRCVMRIAGAQSFDGPLQHRSRRVQVGVADAQQYDVFTALQSLPRRIVNAPRIRAVAGDSLDQG